MSLLHTSNYQSTNETSNTRYNCLQHVSHTLVNNDNMHNND